MIQERSILYSVVQYLICKALLNHNFLINDVNVIKFSLVPVQQLTKKSQQSNIHISKQPFQTQN